MKKRLLLLSILSCIIFTSCEDSVSVGEKTIESVTVNLENTLWTSNTLKEGDAYSGKFFSRIDSATVYGAGYSYQIPDSLVGKAVRVSIQTMARTNALPSNGSIAIALHEGETSLDWKSVPALAALTTPNSWSPLEGFVDFPASLINKPNLHFRIYAFRSPSKENFDVDDLRIQIKLTPLEN